MNWIDLFVFRKVSSVIETTRIIPGSDCEVIWTKDKNSTSICAVSNQEPKLWVSKKELGKYVVYVYFARVILDTFGRDIPFVLFTMNEAAGNGVVTIQPGEDPDVDYFVYAVSVNALTLLCKSLFIKKLKSTAKEVVIVRTALDNAANHINNQNAIDREFDIDDDDFEDKEQLDK